MSKSPFSHPFWSPFSGTGDLPKGLNEWIIIEISRLIRGKPDWKTKYKNKEILAKWDTEISQQFESKLLPDLTNYAFEELKSYEVLEDAFGLNNSKFLISIDEKIATGSFTVPSSLKEKLISELNQLYSDFGDKLDYHPGTDKQVVDLVHPSLFPLQYGKTQIIDPTNPNNLVLSEFTDKIFKVMSGVESFGITRKFQWLPSLLKVNSTTKKYEFDSYINNLHPVKYGNLYDTITDVFNYALPGLNYVLSQFAQPPYYRIKIADGWTAYHEEYRTKIKEIIDRCDKDWTEYEEFEKTKAKYLKEFKPDLEGLQKFAATPDINLTEKFPNLKVIVKLANIELTPEKPDYAGGSWHIEGTINENIVATILYYYDVENIDDSNLSFRCAFEDPEYEQNDETYLSTLYGLHDESPMQRLVGSVKTEEDKIIIFPNCFQHHVDAFSLKDKTKPGYRKILCFFVVDPYNDIVVTTKDVPPQQEDWYDAEGHCTVPDIVPPVLEKQLPKQKQTLDEAKEVRTELMKERSFESSPLYYEEDDPFKRTFSLCEH